MHRSSIQSLPAKTLARQAARAILADPWFSDPAQAPMLFGFDTSRGDFTSTLTHGMAIDVKLDRSIIRFALVGTDWEPAIKYSRVVL
ncbi:uncharacterized protein APUU_60652S [Aspergillus puulaauensis]|uniref:Uncharacterized protein n=1 Tax=Aspergillus puulaauensis TaxID=1220207 RepID=A0A7R7XU90_9EURO|nr:uncharacterized protein APUU_60652S [Aspergillus puulaauensis]BCS27604.1 hypothetical protein APUU_60652S [Aspergillus puulaauensis]